MGRAGALPRVLAYVHPRWKTPWNAIFLLTLCTLGIGLGLGSGIGPVNAFGVIGIMQTLGLIIVYSMGNIGAFWYYLNQKRREFNLLLHFLIPLGSTVALGWVFYENVASLHPFSPSTYFDYSPLMVIIWTVVGIGILVAMAARGKEDWLFSAGEAAHERPETPTERAHRPVL
jgi:amino acid transporter